MDKKKTLWAAPAALLIAAAAVFLFVPKSGTTVIEAETTAPILTDIQKSEEPKISPPPAAAESPASAPKVAANSPKNKTGEVFKLNIHGKMISVAYGVEEDTLKKNPGWLAASAMPGEDGTCVVYGHRNRTHLRVLEKVKIGDAITVIMPDNTTYTYTVAGIQIYEDTADFKLPVTDGEALVLATCYPFRYSGHAQGKCVVTATLH